MGQQSDIDLAHTHSSGHRAELLASETCGCFFCLATFPSSAISEWVGTQKDKELELGETALCPRCGIDSVIGSASGFPVTQEFLSRIELRWFNMRGRRGQ